MTSFEDILAQARLPETSVSLCLRGDLDAQWRELTRKLEGASRTAASLGERSEASTIAEQILALEAEMSASTVAFTLRADTAKDWSDFQATRPTKKDDQDETFTARWFDWVCRMVSRAAVDPVMSPEQVGQLCDRISGAQWDELSDAAWNLNSRSATVPFSYAASAMIPSDDQK